MSVQRIASRYSKSLLDLAKDRNEVEQILQDIQYVRSALRSRDLVLMIKSPIISTGKKLSIFKKLFSGKLSKTTESFFEIMLRKSRENYLPEMVDSFIDQYKAYKQISTVVIKSAEPLSEDSLAIIRQKLSNSVITKKNLEIALVTDPSLIGGFILEYEGRQYDSSMATKLKALRKQFS